MTNYVNWMKLAQPIKGDVLQMEGNPVADHESPATGVASGAAPQGAQYASVWADVATIVQASPLLKGDGTEDTGNYTYVLPANTVLQIPNVIAGSTVIEMTDA